MLTRGDTDAAVDAAPRRPQLTTRRSGQRRDDARRTPSPTVLPSSAGARTASPRPADATGRPPARRPSPAAVVGGLEVTVAGDPQRAARCRPDGAPTRSSSRPAARPAPTIRRRRAAHPLEEPVDAESVAHLEERRPRPRRDGRPSSRPSAAMSGTMRARAAPPCPGATSGATPPSCSRSARSRRTLRLPRRRASAAPRPAAGTPGRPLRSARQVDPVRPRGAPSGSALRAARPTTSPRVTAGRPPVGAAEATVAAVSRQSAGPSATARATAVARHHLARAAARSRSPAVDEHQPEVVDHLVGQLGGDQLAPQPVLVEHVAEAVGPSSPGSTATSSSRAGRVVGQVRARSCGLHRPLGPASRTASSGRVSPAPARRRASYSSASRQLFDLRIDDARSPRARAGPRSNRSGRAARRVLGDRKPSHWSADVGQDGRPRPLGRSAEQRCAVASSVSSPRVDRRAEQHLDVHLAVRGVDPGGVVDRVHVDATAPPGVLDAGPLGEPRGWRPRRPPAPAADAAVTRTSVFARSSTAGRLRCRPHIRADPAGYSRSTGAGGSPG